MIMNDWMNDKWTTKIYQWIDKLMNEWKTRNDWMNNKNWLNEQMNNKWMTKNKSMNK